MIINQCETFSRIFRLKPDQCANYRLPETGETALQLALLMDFKKRKPAYVFEPEVSDTQ